jgi:hypothetical protein
MVNILFGRRRRLYHRDAFDLAANKTKSQVANRVGRGLKSFHGTETGYRC